MGLVGWIMVGLLAAALVRAAFGRSIGDGPPVWLAVGALGGIVGGAAGWVAGVGAASAFYSVGTWLCALAGAIVALALRQAAHAGAFIPEVREGDVRPHDR